MFEAKQNSVVDLEKKIFLYNSDSVDLLRRMKEESIDLVVTDPPYGIDYQNNLRSEYHELLSSKIESDDSFAIIRRVIPEINRVLKPGSALYMFCRDDVLGMFHRLLEEFFDIKNTIAWIKKNQTAGDLEGGYGRRYEMVVFATKPAAPGGEKFRLRGKRRSDVWEFGGVGKERIHPHQKPIPLLRQMIEDASDPGQVVLDPFAGSGSTVLAAWQSGRVGIGIELDKSRFEPMVEFIKTSTTNLFGV